MLNPNKDITSRFEQIVLSDLDCQQGIYFFKKYKNQIDLSKIVSSDYQNGYNQSSFKSSLMYAICYDENLMDLFWFIIKHYVKDNNLKKRYNLTQDDNFSSMLSHLLNDHRFEDIENLFGSKEAFNSFVFGDFKNWDNQNTCPMYLWITINHLYHLDQVIQYFNPSTEDLNKRDSSGDGIFHYFSESTELFNEMGVEETVDFTKSLFDLLINQYNLDINLRNDKGVTPVEFLIGRFFNCKDIRYAVFRSLITNYNVEYNLQKLVNDKSINQEEAQICNQIIIDKNKSKFLLEYL